MRPRTQQFHFPLAGAARIALLEEGFRVEANMREFAPGDLASLRAYAPEALVAPLDLALLLADRKRRGLFDLPGLRTAIVVITSFEDSPLTEDHRDLLWRVWEVPVFEQLRGADGAIVARECEVHDGLHLADEDDRGMRERAGVEIVTGVCECGAETPRLRRLSVARTRQASA